MIQFNVNIPTEKVQQFLTQMAKVGFKKRIEELNYAALKNHNENKWVSKAKEITKHPYCDTDFFEQQ